MRPRKDRRGSKWVDKWYGFTASTNGATHAVPAKRSNEHLQERGFSTCYQFIFVSAPMVVPRFTCLILPSIDGKHYVPITNNDKQSTFCTCWWLQYDYCTGVVYEAYCCCPVAALRRLVAGATEYSSTRVMQTCMVH